MIGDAADRARSVPEPLTAHASRTLRALCDAGIEFVVVGSVAEALVGGSRRPRDVDVVVERSTANLARARDALMTIGGRVCGVRRDVRIGCVELGGRDSWRVITHRGEVDVVLRFADGTAYEDLDAVAREVTIAGSPVRVCP